MTGVQTCALPIWLNHYLKLQGSCADAEAEYWRWLYQYNRQQGGTIHVAGLGTERNTVVSMYGLLALADTEIEPAESIADFVQALRDRKSTRLNSSHVSISYAVYCLKKKKKYKNKKKKKKNT